MFSRLGPINIDCDAPAYGVVEACEKLGFQSPLDVRWCGMSHVHEGQRETGGVVGFHPSCGCSAASSPRSQPVPAANHYL
jgi:hypothetical protein